MASDVRQVRVISTDPGIDDALALIFLEHFLDPPADHVVASGGNVRARLAGNNCAFLKEEFDFRGDLCLGSDPPQSGPVADATEVHGPHGLGTRRSPEAALPRVSELWDTLRSGEGDIDLLVLGPATDAAALLRDEELAPRARRIIMMGGAFESREGRLGNVTPHAEFNVYMDPGAAWAVMADAAFCRMVPLDATEGRLFAAQELLTGVSSGRRGRIVAELVSYLREVHVRRGAGDGVYMHDVLAAAVWAGAIDAEWRKARVGEIVPAGERRGMVVHDEAGGVEVEYASGVDTDQFLRLWHQMAAALDP